MSFFLYVSKGIILIWIAVEVVFECSVFVSLDAYGFKCVCFCSNCLYLPVSKPFAHVNAYIDTLVLTCKQTKAYLLSRVSFF